MPNVIGFDGLANELDDFTRDLINLAQNQMPKKTKKFLRQQGSKLTKEVKNQAKSKVKKKTGNYLKSIKRGKVYTFDDALAIRAFSGAPHAHLIELGHVNKDGTFTEGKYVFKQAYDDYQDTFVSDLETFIDDMLDEGLSR